MSDYYEVLGVPRNATQEQIKKAFVQCVVVGLKSRD